MPDFNKIQQNSINEWRQLHQNMGGMVLSDDAVASAILMEFFTTGKIYPGFEDLVKVSPTDKSESIFATTGILPVGQGWAGCDNSELNLSPTQQKAMDFLRQMTNDASKNMELQERRDGWDNDIANFFKECFNTEYAKSNVQKAISSTKKDMQILESTAIRANSTQISFEEVFYKQRGVEFNIKQINLCDEKAKAMADVQSVRDCINGIKQKLKNSLVNNVGNAIATRDYGNGKIARTQGEFAIIDTLQFLGITNQGDINRLLSEVEAKNTNSAVFSKYGKDMKLEKDDKGNWVINVTNASGERSPILQEHAQLIGKELERKLTLVYAENIGAEYREDMTTEELDNITTDLYNKYKSEYEDSFQKAYGKKDLKALSQNYMMSQQQLATWVNVASFATMFIGSGIPLKGLQYLNTAAQGTRLAATTAKAVAIAADVTMKAEKLMPLLMVNQVAQPVQLLHNLTSDEPDWKAYGMSVAEGSMWMLLGMASGALGDKARLFLKEKGISFIAKNSGLSIDDLMSIYRSGQQVPANLTKAFKMIETVALASGSSVEFVADVMLTSVVNKAVYGTDITTMEKLMSLNGVLLGAAMQRKNIAKSNEMKQGMFELELQKYCPDLDAAEIKSRARMLVELSNIAGDKISAKPRIFEGENQNPVDATSYRLEPEQVDYLNGVKPQEQVAPPELSVEKIMDSQNRLSKEITRDANGVIETVSYLYGSDGTLVAKDTENLVGKFRKVYSPNGKIYSEISYLDGKEHVVSKYSWADDNNYTITRKIRGEDTPFSVESYKNGIITEKIEQYAPLYSPKSIRTTTTKFDEFGQIVERVIKYSDEPNKTTIEKFKDDRLVSTDEKINYVKEDARQLALSFADKVDEIHKNNYENVRILRDFTPEERQWFIDNSLCGGKEADVFVLFANGDKPSSLLPGTIPDSIIEKFKMQGIDILNRDLGSGVTNAFLLNPSEVKKVIDANYELYSNRMGMEGASIDDIYAKLISEDSPLKLEEEYPDLIGLTLGFPPANTLIYNLENQLKGFKLSDRFKEDISEYKELLKAALYSESSPYANMSDEFKADLATTIDSMKKVVRSGEALYGDDKTRSPYYFINYVDEVDEINRIRLSTQGVTSAVRNGEPISILKPTRAQKALASAIRDCGGKDISAIDIHEACANLTEIETERFMQVLNRTWQWKGAAESGFTVKQAALGAKLSDEEFETFSKLISKRGYLRQYKSFEICYEMAKMSKADLERMDKLCFRFSENLEFKDYKKILDYNNDDAAIAFMLKDIPMLQRLTPDEELLFTLMDRGADLEVVNAFIAKQSTFDWEKSLDIEADKKLLVEFLTYLNEDNSDVMTNIIKRRSYSSISEVTDFIKILQDKEILDITRQMLSSEILNKYSDRHFENEFFEKFFESLAKDSTFAKELLEKDILIPKLYMSVKDSKFYKDILLSVSDKLIYAESDYRTKNSIEHFESLIMTMDAFKEDIPPQVIKDIFTKVFSESVPYYDRTDFIKSLKMLTAEDLIYISKAEDMDTVMSTLDVMKKYSDVKLSFKEIADTVTKYELSGYVRPEHIACIKDFAAYNNSAGKEVFDRRYLKSLTHETLKGVTSESLSSIRELILKHDNLRITTNTLSLISKCGSEGCLEILSRDYQKTIPSTSKQMYDEVFLRYAEKAEQFGCLNMQELEAYIKTATKDRAAAGKLMGEIKKAALDEFLSWIPVELQSFVIGKNGTFTAKDFETILAKINESPDLAKILESGKQNKSLPESAILVAGAIIADSPVKYGVWEKYYERVLKLKESNAKDATTKTEAEAQGINIDEIPDNDFELSPEMKANFTQFAKNFEYMQESIDVLIAKLEKYAEAHGQMDEYNEEFGRVSEGLLETYIAIKDCADVIGEGHLTMLLHDESIVRIMETTGNISIMKSQGTIGFWTGIFAGTKLKDNEVKQLLSLARGLDSSLMSQILPRCSEKVELPSGKVGLKLDVQKMFGEVFNLITENVGPEYKNRPELLEGWDMRYFTYLLGAQKTLGSADKDLLKGLLQSTFDGNYKDFLFDETSPNGTLNLKTKDIYEENGLNFTQWLEYDGVKEIEIKASKDKLKNTIDNVVRGMEADFGVIFANDKLKGRIVRCLEKEGFVFNNGTLQMKSGEPIDKDSLIKLSLAVTDFTNEQGILFKNAGILDIKDHFDARLRILTRATNLSKDEKFSISLWKRDARHDLFQGHYCQCCISLDGINKRAIVHSLSHVVDNIVELKDSAGETVGKAKVLWIKDNNTGEPALLVNGFEITGTGTYNDQVRDAFTEFFKGYSKAVAGKDVAIYTGICPYQKVTLDDLPDYTSNINMLGAFPDNTYHLDAFHADNPGSWPTGLDEAKDLKMKVLYKPE